MNTIQQNCTAFAGARRIASGPLARVAEVAKAFVDEGTPEPILIFEDDTGRQVEVDFRGTVYDVVGRLLTRAQPAPPASRGPGRPRLGVVAREVTLLPRHWEWLSEQPGGASVALRKLVEQARRTHASADDVRAAQDATYRVMVALAGNAVGFEEATRALFAREATRFAELTSQWPDDVRDFVSRLATPVFAA